MRTLPIVAMVCASAIAVAIVGPSASGCGGGGGGGSGSAASAATTGFGVVATAPTDGDGAVDPTALLFVTFDQDVDAASIGSSANGAIALIDDRGPVTAALRLVTPRIVEVAPSGALAFNRAHVLRVTTQVLATSGAPLAVEHLVRFSTHGPKVAVPVGSTTTSTGPWVAGAAEVDMSPPRGTPMAGYGGGDRRLKFPDLNPFDLHTFLVPSQGERDPCRVKALVIGNDVDKVAIMTLDAIATEAAVLEAAVTKARALGFTVPLERVMCVASHSHSGPGAISKKMLWQLAAADLYVDRVFQHITDKMALALSQAEVTSAPVVLGVGRTLVTTATRNRRAGESPDLDPDDIDPELQVIRVDTVGGAPVATLWNFAIHGTHFGTSQMQLTADIMGSCSNKLEAAGGAGIALFMNGAEGDIAPTGGYDATGQLLADAVMAARANATTTPGGFLGSTCELVDMGQPVFDVSVQRIGSSMPNLTHNGFLNGLQNLGIGPGVSLALPRGWMENEFRYQAIRIGKAVIASMPGEPIHELGLLIKADGHAKGFDHVMTAGLANGHGAYFTSEKEYWYGGYEGIASLFGPKNGEILVNAAIRQMEKLKP